MREDISFEKYLRAKNVIIKKTNTNMNIIMYQEQKKFYCHIRNKVMGQNKYRK